MNNDLQKTIEGMDSAGLDELAGKVRDAQEAKRDKLDINSIRPGMSPEEVARARAEIAKVLAGK